MNDVTENGLDKEFDLNENLNSNPALKILFDYAAESKKYVGYCDNLDYFLNDLTFKVLGEFTEKPFTFIKDSLGNISSLHISEEITAKYDVHLVAKVIWHIVHNVNFTPSDFSTLKNVLAQFTDILKKKELFTEVNNDEIDTATNVAFDLYQISKKSY